MTHATLCALKGGRVISEIKSVLGGFMNREFTSWEMHLGANGRKDELVPAF